MGGGAIELTTLLDSVGWEETFFTKFREELSAYRVYNSKMSKSSKDDIASFKNWIYEFSLNGNFLISYKRSK